MIARLKQRVNNMNRILANSKRSTTQMAWLETLILTMLVVVIGYVINPLDPFYLNRPFPWLILAPLLIALRYGFIYGMGSTCSFILLFSMGRYLNWSIVPNFPVEMVVGMVAVTMIVTEFHDIWQRKIQSLLTKYRQMILKMNKFSRTYHILKASHSKLEQQTANYVKSLRSSLHEIERQILSLENDEGAPFDGIGEHILDILGEYGSIQTAAVYAVLEQQKIRPDPVASLGNPPALSAKNHLVVSALDSGCVTSIQTHEEIANDVLVVIPLIDVLHKTWGLVVIHEMSMFAMQQNTLDLLALLGGYIGDLIRRRSEVNRLRKDAWLNFEYELRRILKNVSAFKTDAGIVISIINDEETQDSLISKFNYGLRELDKVFHFEDTSGRYVVIKLLPLTDEQGLKQFLSRLDLTNTIDIESLSETENNHVYRPLDNDIILYSWTLNASHSPEAVLSKIARLCHHNVSIEKQDSYYERISA